MTVKAATNRAATTAAAATTTTTKPTAAEIQQAEVQVDEAKATVSADEKAVTETKLYAPAAGMIASLSSDSIGADRLERQLFQLGGVAERGGKLEAPAPREARRAPAPALPS